jgi:HlyD family type I secretion membrane fusion protein
MVGLSSTQKAAQAETASLAYSSMPFSQRTDRYSKRLFTVTFCMVVLMVSGLIGLFTWSWYSTIEESIPGMGQIMPTDKIRRIMAPTGGRIKRLLVREDQLVHAGDILMELDAEDNMVEDQGMSAQLELLEQDSRALRAAAGHGGGGLGSLRGAWLTASDQAYHAQKYQAAMGVERADHDYQQLLERLKQQAAELKKAEEQLVNYQTLFQEDGISERELREYELKVIQMRGDLAISKEAMESQKIALMQSKTRTTEITGTFQSNYLDRLAENERRIIDLALQKKRVKLDEKRRYIYAPVDGYVNQQAVHGVGEMVGAGQVLLSLVPAHSDLIAEIMVANKDLAYIYPKQRISLNIEAFPSQHFGKLYGTIVSMSPSSQEADPSGRPNDHPHYLLRVKPDRLYMKYNGKSFPLRSGMTVTADIITQKKPILSFFVEPVQMHLDRAFRDPSSR